MSKDRLLELGHRQEQVDQRAFETHLPLSLGELTQEKVFILPQNVGSRDFGGVKIAGLLSHAFLNEYSWTIDFENRAFIFSQNE